ncbi:hypothetical protein [Histidinibacterium lentulum]|uniref:Uncharacterized protein n=1 Tax=Histidinibacterium lentulum TaxID=2480588 RepID=A0A3N2R741_9RHOB|nr:hypothetical protein [Histidinibacterium lentulum]ROU03312.1 hypothetical protein EAT49_03115 [Histidinibacterium lentulum]
MEPTKTPLTEEQKLRRRAGRTLARAMFVERIKETRPELTAEERKEAWKAEGKAETRRAMRYLRKLHGSGIGLTVVAADAAGTDADEAAA